MNDLFGTRHGVCYGVCPRSPARHRRPSRREERVMRFTLVAAVLGLIGCAGGQSDPASVVEGLTQEQMDQTQWLYNVETRDLVAADALQGAVEGFEVVEVVRYGDSILACEPGKTGIKVDVLMDGEIRP